MVTRWGMSERLGTISFSERQSPFAGGGDTGAPTDYSEETAQLIDEEVDRIVRTCYAQTVKIMENHRETLARIAQEYRRLETIDSAIHHDILLTPVANIQPLTHTPKPPP